MDKVDRIYNTKKEWTKDIKFNNQWFHLKSIYDMDDKPDEFDFNSTLADGEFDFNSEPQDVEYVLDPDSIEISEPEYDDIDFNAIYESELGESGFDYLNLISDKSKYKDAFKKFVSYVKANGQKDEFFIEAGLLITDKDGNVIANAGKDQNIPNIDKVKEVLGTILKRGGGYTNEAVMQMIMGKHDLKDSDAQILKYLHTLVNANEDSSMANRFPDTMFIDPRAGIPVDLKVSYNGEHNTASASNLSYMSGIYAALLNAINKKVKLIDFIKNAPLGHYNAGNDTNYDFYIVGKNAKVMPELKGFLLYSQTTYDEATHKLHYYGFEISPIIACMKNNNGLFSSKQGDGQGSVSYGAEKSDIYDESDSILYGLPKGFADTINLFFHMLLNDGEKNYKQFVKQSKDKDFIDNLKLIVNKIDGKDDAVIKAEENQAKAEKLEDQKNENTQWIIEQYQSKILSKYGLVECFKSINEDDEFSDVSKEEQLEIQSATAKSLASLEKVDKSKASTIASKIKKVFLAHGKKAFLAACVALSLLSGNASASMANSLERLNSGANHPTEIINQLIPGGGIELERTAVNKFINHNFNDLDSIKSKKMKDEIMKALENNNRYVLITPNFPKLSDIKQSLFNDQTNIHVIKYYINRDHPNIDGKYQALVIAEL